MPMETGPSTGLSKPPSFFATQKTVSTDLGINNAQSHADPNKLPTEDSNGFTGTFRSSRQTLSSYGVENRSPYCTPNSSQKNNNAAQHRPLLRQPAIEQIEGLVSISGSGFERKSIHSPTERHPTVGVSDQNRPIAHPNSSVGDTNIDAFSFIKDEKGFDGDEIHPQRASCDVERHAELSENLPSLEGQQSVDNSKDYISFPNETRDTDFIIRLESIEIQDTEPLDLSSLDVPTPERPTQNKESTSEVKDCPVPALSHDRNKKWQFIGTSFDEPTSINQNSDFDEDETFLKIPVTSPSRILNEESTDVENHSELTTTHALAEEEHSVGSFQNSSSTQSKSQGVWKENNFSLESLGLFSNQPEKDVINPKIPSNPEIPTNEAVCLEIPTDTDNLSVEQSSEESVTDTVVWSSSIHHEVFALREPGFLASSLHMQSTDEVLPIEQQKSLASTEQQFFSCSLPYFSLPSKTKCYQEGDSIQSLPSRVSCEDSLNPNERDSDHCLDCSNEDTSINGSSSMTHDLYLDDLRTLWMKFEIFLRILYLRSTCEEQHFEESTNQFAEDAQQCIIRLLRDSSTRSKIRNENCSLIEEENSHQSLETNIVGQSSKCENETNTMIPSHSKEAAVSLIDKHSDDGKKLGGTAKDPSISSYSQSQKVALDDNAPLPIDINTIDTSMSPGHKHRQLLTYDFDDEVLLPIDANMSPGSPHVQLTNDERHSEDFLTHSAPTFNQCNESFKNQLTQSLTRNDCELRISKDSSFQSLDEDLRDQDSCWKNDTNSKSPIKNLDEAGKESVLDTCDIDLVGWSNESIKDTSIASYSQSQEYNFDDHTQLPKYTNMSPGYRHLQLTDDKRHSEVFMNHSAPNINQCNDSSKHYLTRSTTQNACEWRILRDDSLQGFDADFREQSPWLKYALNSMPLNQHIDTGNPDTNIGRFPQSRAFDFNNDAPLPMDTNVDPGSEHLQLTNVEQQQYSPPYSTKKYDEHEVQECKEISQKSSPKRKNSDKTIQESPYVVENSANSTKCIKNENSDNPKDTNDADLHEGVNTDNSIGRCLEITEEDAKLPMEIKLNSRSEHLQSTNVQRHPYSPPYRAKKYDEAEVQRFKEISQKSSPKRKNSATTLQESPPVGENLASSTKCKKDENSDSPRDTNDADLHKGVNADKSIDRCPEITEEFLSDEDATLPMEIELNLRSEQPTNIQRHLYSPPYKAKKYDEPEIQRCKEISKKSSLKRKNSVTMIQESPPVDENSASSTKCKKNENSDSPKDTNDADLQEGVKTDKITDICPAIREEFHSDEDATFLMGVEVNSSKEADIRCHRSLMEIKLTSESPTRNNYITNQRTLRDKTGSALKEKTNESTMKVAEDSGSLTQNQEIRIPESFRKISDDRSSYESATEYSIGRYFQKSQECYCDEDTVLPMEPEVNQRSLQLRLPNVVRQSDELTNYSAPDVQQFNKTPLVSIPTKAKASAFWGNVANSEMLTQENVIENKGSLDDTRDVDFNLSQDTSIARPQMDGSFYRNDNVPLPMLSGVNPGHENDIPLRGPFAEVGASSESFTRNNEIGFPGCMDTCIGRHSDIIQEFDCNEVATEPREPEKNPRSQYVQLIDVERHSKICKNLLQHCNNGFHNLLSTENKTQHVRDSCPQDVRFFQNQDRATRSRGTVLEDVATLDVDDFSNGSTTDHISMYGYVVTIYGSAPQSEHYEVRLSETVRPIDEHNSLMWDDRMEDDDAVMSGQHLASSEDNMDSTDTLPNIRQLLSSSCVQLRTSFIGFNSFQRDSNPSRHVPLSTEANQNESIPYEMDEEFVTISGSGSLHELFNGSEERRFRFSERVRPYNNRNS